MPSTQPAVAATGFGLVLANYWLGGARQQVSSGALSSSATPAQTTAAHSTLQKVFLELAFVLVATIVAGTSNTAGSAMLAVMVALGIVWALNHYSTSTG